jgi:hypothetical protein
MAHPVSAHRHSHGYRRSYWKTIVAAALAAALVLVVAAGAGARVLAAGDSVAIALVALWGVLAAVAVVTSGTCLLIAAGGVIALRRDRLEARGKPYGLPDSPRWGRNAGSRNWVSALAGQDAVGRRLRLRPGEFVEIRSAQEILATLDAAGMLDSLPFMPEMLQHCGRGARVRRRVEKIWDMKGGSGLRRLRDAVLLDGLRCDGAAHDGCQAGCYLLWKEAWLRRVDAAHGAVVPETAGFGRTAVQSPSVPLDLSGHTRHQGPDGVQYVCQATELPRASSPMSQGDPRHYLRELAVGNVGMGRFLCGAAIAAFNGVQRARGGSGFPQLMPGARGRTPLQPLGLAPGDLVAVKSKGEIEESLDEGKRNRGLYFDHDMVRYCGGRYRVLRIVERLIDERTGRMVTVRAPCVVLDGVVATGEYHAFRAQEEHILWRETWLTGPHRSEDGAGSAGDGFPRSPPPRDTEQDVRGSTGRGTG